MCDSLTTSSDFERVSAADTGTRKGYQDGFKSIIFLLAKILGLRLIHRSIIAKCHVKRGKTGESSKHVERQ